jgi:hypothetical protein
MNLRAVKCYYSNGDEITTNVNGKLTDYEIFKYFVGKWFNIGNVENDNMAKCKAVEILE